MHIIPNSPPDLYITSELATRIAGPADYLLEKRAIQELAARMAHQPAEVLPRFVDLRVENLFAVSDAMVRAC